MKNRLLLSIAIGVLASPMAMAEMRPVELQNVPLHLLSCSASSLQGWVATTSARGANREGSLVYQAGYRPATSSGSLKKQLVGRLNETEWDAGVLLTNRKTPRHLWTASEANGRFGGVPFVWMSLDERQKSALNRSPTTGSDDGLGARRLDYVRGMRTDEGVLFPKRERLLGAIVHGTPMEVEHDQRSTIYVGAGDGMLHAFDAHAGDELFSYIPRAIVERLPVSTKLDDPESLPLDGGMAIADVHSGDRRNSVLVAGMGRGAQGVFALDVSSPSAFEGGDVLWEFTDKDDADIGNVIGTPTIARFRVGLQRGVARFRYFAVVPGGVNNHVKDAYFNTAAPAAIFLLALDKPATEPWRIGISYFKFILPAEGRQANGVTDVALVTAADGTADVGYAGDLQGNLWRFDFGGNAPDSAPPQRLFVARDAAGNRQSVTQRARIVFAPERGHVVLFGTGKYLESSDLDRGAFDVQSFYGIWDASGERISGRSALVERTVRPHDDGTYEIDGTAVQYGPAGNKGWYLDFPQSKSGGERSVATATVLDTRVAFTTLIPAAASCTAPFGRTYLLDTLNGLPMAGARFTAYLSEAGFPGISPPFVVLPTEISERDATGKRRITTRLERTATRTDTQQADSPSDETVIQTVTTAGRLSWREIIDWLEWRSK